VRAVGWSYCGAAREVRHRSLLEEPTLSSTPHPPPHTPLLALPSPLPPAQIPPGLRHLRQAAGRSARGGLREGARHHDRHQERRGCRSGRSVSAARNFRLNGHALFYGRAANCACCTARAMCSLLDVSAVCHVLCLEEGSSLQSWCPTPADAKPRGWTSHAVCIACRVAQRIAMGACEKAGTFDQSRRPAYPSSTRSHAEFVSISMHTAVEFDPKYAVSSIIQMQTPGL